MRRWGGDSRGLAEIVGTLMLVVIVVAAATAFSFFVASYQKQVQSEETVVHDRALEKVKLISLASSGCSDYNNTSKTCHRSLPNGEFARITVKAASLDINSIAVTGVFLSGHPVDNYSVIIGRTTYSPCFNATSETTLACQPVLLPPYSESEFVFNLNDSSNFTKLPKCSTVRILDCLYAFGTPYNSTDLSTSHELELELLTSLGNSFLGTFVPPVAKLGVSFVNSWPVLDGSGSYQPSGGVTTNATIDQWTWTVRGGAGDPDNGPYFGQQVELPYQFVLGGNYSLILTVTNALGLIGTVSVAYTAPG
jgi:flagellin-like protein